MISKERTIRKEKRRWVRKREEVGLIRTTTRGVTRRYTVWEMILLSRTFHDLSTFRTTLSLHWYNPRLQLKNKRQSFCKFTTTLNSKSVYEHQYEIKILDFTMYQVFAKYLTFSNLIFSTFWGYHYFVDKKTEFGEMKKLA